MKNILSNILNFIVYHFRLYKLFGTKNKVVLLYHRINKDNFIHTKYLKGILVKEEMFNKQMQLLKLSNRKNDVIITFDDGYKDNFQYALPILNKYNLQAIFFVTTDFIDQKIYQWIDVLNEYAIQNELSLKEFKEKSIYIKSLDINLRNKYLNKLSKNINLKKLENDKAMNWKEVKKLSQTQIIGGHTLSHPNFSKENKESIKKELCLSKSIIEEHIKKKIIYFAYPDGDIGKDINYIEKILQECHYEYAFTTKRGSWNKDDNNYFINRIPVYYWDSLATFNNKCYGINIEDNLSFRNISIKILEILGLKEWVKKKLKY